MRLSEHLKELDIVQLDNIAKNLHRGDVKDYFNAKKVYIERISNELDNYLWDIIENKDPEIHIDEKVLLDLKKLSFGINEIDESSYIRLRNLGIIYREKEIPDDLKKKFIEQWRPGLVIKLENYPIEVKLSMFLKLFLLIQYIEKGILNTAEDILNSNIASDEILRILMDYLKSIKIISIDSDDSVALNDYVLKLWRKSSKKIMGEFYEFYFLNKNMSLNLVFKTLKLVQEDSEEWINLNNCKFIVEAFEDEISDLKSIGIISYVRDDSSEYIQLSPEFWFLLTEQQPQIWNIQNVIITPDFELFIPYYFDPFIIDMVNRDNELQNQVMIINKSKNKKIQNKKVKKIKSKKEIEHADFGFISDYYLIYNIKNLKEKINDEIFNDKFVEIFKCIMPDIIKDEFRVSLDDV